jgi:uncharacterized protein (TIGR03437 family)
MFKIGKNVQDSPLHRTDARRLAYYEDSMLVSSSAEFKRSPFLLQLCFAVLMNASVCAATDFQLQPSSGQQTLPSTLVITTTTLPEGRVYSPYSARLTAANGVDPYVFELNQITFPPGLVLNPDGTILGTPLTAGVYSVDFRVRDARGQFARVGLTLRITSATLNFETTEIPIGQAGQPYSFRLTAMGGVAPYTFTHNGGTFPPGLTLAANGTISGTPVVHGNFGVELRVLDSGGTTLSWSTSILIRASELRMTSQVLPAGVVGRSYGASIEASGGTRPYAFTLLSGTPPPGIVLNREGTLTGSPVTTGSYSFTVRVTDAPGFSAESSITIQVNSNELRLTPMAVSGATINVPFSVSFSGSGGSAPYSFGIPGGNVPPGLGLTSTGIMSGTPTQAGNFRFSIRLIDSSGSQAIFEISLTVAGPAISFPATSLPVAYLSLQYTIRVAVAGGQPPYTFQLGGGSLPPGLSIDPGGQFSGTATALGTYSFVLRVTDANNSSGEATFQVSVISPPGLAFGTAFLPAAQLDRPYSGMIAAVGGTPPYRFSLISPAPPGISISTTGVLTGTPTTPGTFAMRIRVDDSAGASANAQFELVVGASNLGITTVVLPSAIVNQFYSQNIAAVGGVPPYRFSLIQGNLPTGMQFSAGGTVSGTPSARGPFPLVVRVTDASGLASESNVAFSVGPSMPMFATTSLPSGTVGQFYSFELHVAGGAAPYSFSVLGGSLPFGLSLSQEGRVSGTPAAPGMSQVTFRVSDATGSAAQATLGIQVLAGASTSTLAAVIPTPPVGTVGQNYVTILAASGGTAPRTWSVASGSLPPGLQISSPSSIVGIPTAAGTFSFTLRLQDATSAFVLSNLLITINPNPLRFTTTGLPTATVGTAYNAQISVAGGPPPFDFQLVQTTAAGLMPPGLALRQDGAITGIPRTAGVFPFTVTARDNANLRVQGQFTIVVSGTPPQITTTSLPNAVIGSPYSQSVAATGGSTPYAFQIITGALPVGLLLSPSSGVISGTPTTASSASFTVQVRDNANLTSERLLTIAVTAPAEPLSIAASAPPPGQLFYPYDFSLRANGGTPPRTFSIPTGPIPNGLRLDPNGSFHGTFLTPGSYRFMVRVTDAAGGMAEVPMAVNVAAGLRLATAVVGQSYTAQAPPPLGGSGPFTFTRNANAIGGLPEGIELSSTGAISGMAVTAGEYTFGIAIRAANGFTANTTVTLPVVQHEGFRIVTASLPGGVASSPYSQILTAAGGREPYNWTVSSGSLPSGLSLDPLTGAISGTPALSSHQFFTIRVTDATGAQATTFYNLAVSGPRMPLIGAITSAASYTGNGVVPGEVITIFGGQLGAPGLSTFSMVNGLVPTQLSATRVLFDGMPAPVLYTRSDQIGAITPFALEGRAYVRVVVEYQSAQSAPFPLPLLSSKPAIFTADSSGRGPGAILNQNGSVNTSENPAARGSVVVLYLTGGGAMTPAGLDGAPASGPSSLNSRSGVLINGIPSQVLYAGNAPGLVTGVIQLNVQLPPGVQSGQNPIVVAIGSNATTENVTVWIE